MKNFIKRSLQAVSKLTLGLVFVLIWGVMFIRTDALFPNGNIAAWKEYITTYIIFTTLIFGISAAQKTEKSLFKLSFLKEFPKFIIGALISGVILYIVGFVLKGSALPTIKTALFGIGAGTLLLYVFAGCTMEELGFRGKIVEWLYKAKMKKPLVYLFQALIFAAFHWGLSRSIWTTLIYIPLGLLFMAIKDRYSPQTNMANAGVHFAWNVFILGFMS